MTTKSQSITLSISYDDGDCLAPDEWDWDEILGVGRRYGVPGVTVEVTQAGPVTDRIVRLSGLTPGGVCREDVPAFTTDDFIEHALQEPEPVKPEPVKPELPLPEIGSHFVNTWGYDQTNVDFYEVVGLTASGKSVKLRRVYNRADTERSGENANYVFPDAGNFYPDTSDEPFRSNYGKVLTKRLKVKDWKGDPEWYVTMDHGWCGQWHGSSVYETPWHMGH